MLGYKITEKMITNILAKPSGQRTNREWYILGYYGEVVREREQEVIIHGAEGKLRAVALKRY